MNSNTRAQFVIIIIIWLDTFHHAGNVHRGERISSSGWMIFYYFIFPNCCTLTCVYYIKLWNILIFIYNHNIYIGSSEFRLTKTARRLYWFSRNPQRFGHTKCGWYYIYVICKHIFWIHLTFKCDDWVFFDWYGLVRYFNELRKRKFDLNRYGLMVEHSMLRYRRYIEYIAGVQFNRIGE